jgi:hypothetical protein
MTTHPALIRLRSKVARALQGRIEVGKKIQERSLQPPHDFGSYKKSADAWSIDNVEFLKALFSSSVSQTNILKTISTLE